jgi:hypothetical protein
MRRRYKGFKHLRFEERKRYRPVLHRMSIGAVLADMAKLGGTVDLRSLVTEKTEGKKKDLTTYQCICYAEIEGNYE